VKEARKLGIPVVAVVDTNCDPDEVDYVIPGNDDALRAIRLFTTKISEAVVEGRTLATEQEFAAEKIVSDDESGEQLRKSTRSIWIRNTLSSLCRRVWPPAASRKLHRVKVRAAKRPEERCYYDSQRTLIVGVKIMGDQPGTVRSPELCKEEQRRADWVLRTKRIYGRD
jgi:hypothetical protein